jgi:hypothetical protein
MNQPPDNVYAFVRKWLDQQGYPLELRVGRVFAEAGWNVSHAAFYEDPETHKQREIDLYAFTSPPQLPGVGVVLAVECKTSPKKPWVAFSSQRSAAQARMAALWHVPWGVGQDAVSRFATLTAGALPTVFDMPALVAHGAASVKNGDGPDPAYAAVMSAAKAAAARAAFDNRGVLEEAWPLIEIVFPVVVLDGHLFEFFLASDGTEQLQEVEQVKLLMTDRSIGTDVLVVTITTEQGLFVLSQRLKAAAASVVEQMTEEVTRSVYNAFRARHGKKPPVDTWKRDHLLKEIPRLSDPQQRVLRHLVRLGRLSSLQAADFLLDEGVWSGGTPDSYDPKAVLLLDGIAGAGLIDLRDGFYVPSANMLSVLQEWAAS